MIKIKIVAAAFLFLLSYSVVAQKITTPLEHFGFNIGDDYKLANYTQTEAYFQKIAKQSDRTLIQEVGQTEEGRKQYMMIVSSPENLKHLAEYKVISQKLARAEGLNDEEAALLVQKGKPVVWIDGGLHATETVGSQQLIDLYYRLLSQNDPATLKILDNVIILLSEVNPDGQEMVANWYMSENDTSKRNMKIPFLYNKYIGHDNNRDFYMNNIRETQNVSRQLYLEWMPQIVYNHHQAGPAGSVVAGPPYRDPFNYAYDPLLVTSIDGVAASMISKLNAEHKPGYTRLGGSVFNGWWNGGLRTTPYFHNMVGLLTEIIGNPTPAKVPLVPDRLVPNNATPFPVLPQNWKFRQSIDYSYALNFAVLDYASRNGDKLLENIYLMGKNSIQKGSQDTWTVLPNDVKMMQDDWEKDKAKMDSAGKTKAKNMPMKYYDRVMKDLSLRDPRGYILPADQSDFPTAVKFINALIQSGIKVLKADAAFNVNGKNYPAGSFVVPTAQAFRPHVIDMFEPQNYPNDFQYPGGPPISPYDATGWTLAFQMGVQFERILDKFEGPFKPVAYGELQQPIPQKIKTSNKGYLFSVKQNNSFIVVNNLMKAGIPVSRITSSVGKMPEGSFYADEKGIEILKNAASELGVEVVAATSKPSGAISIKPSRVALFDRYGGSIPSGWVRWLLEQFNYNYTLIYPKDIDAGNLNAKYDMILLVNEGIPSFTKNKKEDFFSEDAAPKENEVPEKYRRLMGSLTVQNSIPQLKTFLENGGDIVTIGKNTDLAYYLGLPVKNALVETNSKGVISNLKDEKYYIPTSILQANINTKTPVNWGMPETADIVFNNSPVFKIDANAKNIEPLISFGNKEPLRSGWGWGQSYLKNGVTAFVAQYGKGKLFAFGPEIIFRAQAHGSFKMLFNTLYLNN